jgi:hypothetical protein
LNESSAVANFWHFRAKVNERFFEKLGGALNRIIPFSGIGLSFVPKRPW